MCPAPPWNTGRATARAASSTPAASTTTHQRSPRTGGTSWRCSDARPPTSCRCYDTWCAQHARAARARRACVVSRCMLACARVACLTCACARARGATRCERRREPTRIHTAQHRRSIAISLSSEAACATMCSVWQLRVWGDEAYLRSCALPSADASRVPRTQMFYQQMLGMGRVSTAPPPPPHRRPTNRRTAAPHRPFCGAYPASSKPHTHTPVPYAVKLSPPHQHRRRLVHRVRARRRRLTG